VEPKYTESRRDSIKGIMRLLLICKIRYRSVYCTCSIVKEVGVCVTTTPCLSSLDIGAIYEAFLVAMGDYTSDRRGDVGAL